MSKKILFYYQCFGTGGAEKCSIKMLTELKKKGYDIDIVADCPNPATFKMLDGFSVDYLCQKTYPWGSGIIKQAVYLAYSKTVRLFSSGKINKRRYDTVIIGLHGTPLRYIKTKKIANRAVQFVHTDIAKMKNAKRTIEITKKNAPYIDCYVCVSGGVYDSFVSLFPELKEKTFRIYNILDTDELRKKVNESKNPYPSTDKPIVVTVARLSDKSKALFRMIDVCKELVDRKLDFIWYIVGNGPDEEKMKQLIDEYKINDQMVMLGYKADPIPYYKYADLTAVLSYHEGFCTVVNEAKISGCAVIATEFSAIHEQLEHGKNGYIVENEKQAITEGMAVLLQDEELRKRITNDYLSDEILDDEKKIDKLEELL